MPPDFVAIFKKYVEIVGSNEGTVFLYESEWTPDEWRAIKAVLNYQELDEPPWARKKEPADVQ